MSENEEIDVGGSEQAHTAEVEVVPLLGLSVLDRLAQASDNEDEEVETVGSAESPIRDEGKLSELPDSSEGGLADASRPNGGIAIDTLNKKQRKIPKHSEVKEPSSVQPSGSKSVTATTKGRSLKSRKGITSQAEEKEVRTDRLLILSEGVKMRGRRLPSRDSRGNELQPFLA